MEDIDDGKGGEVILCAVKGPFPACLMRALFDESVGFMLTKEGTQCS